MKLGRIHEKIIEDDSDKILVIGGRFSGKTTIAMLRAYREMKMGKSVLFVTYYASVPILYEYAEHIMGSENIEKVSSIELRVGNGTMRFAAKYHDGYDIVIVDNAEYLELRVLNEIVKNADRIMILATPVYDNILLYDIWRNDNEWVKYQVRSFDNPEFSGVVAQRIIKDFGMEYYQYVVEANPFGFARGIIV